MHFLVFIHLSGAKPTIIEAPKNITVIQHEDVVFTCKVTGGPQPEVFWKKGEIFLLFLLKFGCISSPEINNVNSSVLKKNVNLWLDSILVSILRVLYTILGDGFAYIMRLYRT